jgi:DNA mismatch endonuclease (patch repair protein)
MTSRSPARTSPIPSSESVSHRMSRQARRDTAPELELRRELHRRGLRFRVSLSPVRHVRSTPDLVFTRSKLAVFVDGCFWHSCPKHGTMPAANRDWWRQKLERNEARDRATDEALAAAGWRVIRVWEHETAPDAADRIETIVRQRPLRPER